MDPSLLDSNAAAGTAFQNYLNQDPKLLQYSALVFKKVMAQLSVAKPDILLVPGDITKDGEKIDHQVMAGFFDKLRDQGIAVYVMPGNHDINNAKAKRYVGNNEYPVAMTSRAEFESIYANFGYRAAIARDTASLSYVVQLQPGLRLISIDANFPGGENYADYANQFLSQHLDGYFYAYLNTLYGAPPSLATFAAPLFRNGIMAHFAGDENMPADQQTLINQLAGISPQLAGIVTTLWTDTGVADNNTEITISN